MKYRGTICAILLAAMCIGSATYYNYNIRDIDFYGFGIMDPTYKLSAPWVDVRKHMSSVTYAAWLLDNTTNVTSALQAAVNTGGVVLIPAGTFTYSTTLTLGTNTVLVGTGKKSILKYTGTDNAIYVTRSTSAGDLDVITLSNFRLEAPNVAVGILLDVVYGVTINKIDAWGSHTGFTDSIIKIRSSQTQNSGNINIEHSTLMGAAGHGIRFDQDAPGPGMGAANVNILGNKIEQNYGHGIFCDDLTFSSANITGNVIENNDAGEITLYYGLGTIIAGNTILHVTATGYALNLGDATGATGRFRSGSVTANNITSQTTSYVVGLNTFEFSTYAGNYEVGGTVSPMNIPGSIQGSFVSYVDTQILPDLRVSNLIVNDGSLHTVVDNRAGVRLRSWAASAISNSAAEVNTLSKAAGKMIWDNTNKTVKVAIGANATDNWVNTDGTNPVTPTP